MPDLYLLLDLKPREPGALEQLPDAVFFDGVKALMLNEQCNGDGWVRTWSATADREEAIRLAAERETLVVIPLDAETLPLGEID